MSAESHKSLNLEEFFQLNKTLPSVKNLTSLKTECEFREFTVLYPYNLAKKKARTSDLTQVSPPAAEHVAFKTFLEIEGKEQDVVFKFRSRPLTQFPKAHGKTKLATYKKMRSYVRKFQSQNLILNQVLILEDGNGQQYWVEYFLEGFRHFRLKSLRDKAKQNMVLDESEAKAILLDFCKFVHHESLGYHVPADLQGAMSGEKIILSDLEFTDTIFPFEFQAHLLLGIFEKEYGLDGHLFTNHFVTKDGQRIFILRDGSLFEYETGDDLDLMNEFQVIQDGATFKNDTLLFVPKTGTLVFFGEEITLNLKPLKVIIHRNAILFKQIVSLNL